MNQMGKGFVCERKAKKDSCVFFEKNLLNEEPVRRMSGLNDAIPLLVPQDYLYAFNRDDLCCLKDSLLAYSRFLRRAIAKCTSKERSDYLKGQIVYVEGLLTRFSTGG